MLREKFPEFCGSPSPPVGGAGPTARSPGPEGWRLGRGQGGGATPHRPPPRGSRPRRPWLGSIIILAAPCPPLWRLLPPLLLLRFTCPQQGEVSAGRVQVTLTLHLSCSQSRTLIRSDVPARFYIEAHSGLPSALAAPQLSGRSHGQCCFVPAASPPES